MQRDQKVIAAALDQVTELLSVGEDTATNTSIRFPDNLREATRIAVDVLGLAPTTTALATTALRNTLEAAAAEVALELHYAANPDVRPTLGDLAVAAAEIDGHDLAESAEILHRAAAEIVQTRPDATGDDVLLWAEAQQRAGAA